MGNVRNLRSGHIQVKVLPETTDRIHRLAERARRVFGWNRADTLRAMLARGFDSVELEIRVHESREQQVPPPPAV